MENFDKKIRESLNQHELPLDAGAWASMEQALDKAMPVGGATGTASTGTSWGWYAAGSAFVIAAGVALFALLSVNENNIGDSLASTRNDQIPVVDQIESKNQNNASVALYQDLEEKEESIDQESISENASDKNESISEQGKKVQEAVQPELTQSEETEHEILDNEEDDNREVEKTSQKGFLLGFSPSSREVCAGETVTFLNNTSEENIQFNWNFGDGNTSSEHDPNHVFTTAGSYSVTLNGTRRGTDISEDQTINILVKTSPKAEILSSKDSKVDNLVSYETLITNGQTAEWKFSDGIRAKGNKANHLYLKPGVQKVNLIVKNSNGCIDRMDLNESITEELEFFVGNTFTPDGDGNNDAFYIPVLRELNVPFQLQVVDMNSQVVFMTNDANEAWNGKHLNTGAPMPDGKYSYRLTLDQSYLKNNTITGKFNLLR